jgi:hypothetical protein
MSQTAVNVKARIQHKHDIEANWLKAVNFTPKQAEIVVYDVEFDKDGNQLELPEGRTTAYTHERFKIGDGIHNINDLPFTLEAPVKHITKLPTENINDKVLYILTSAAFIHNRHVVDNSTCYIVNNRPEVGEPATNLNRDTITAYYDLSDQQVYGYLDETLATAFSTLAGIAVEAGWYNATLLLPIAGWDYTGVIGNIGEDPNDSTIRLLLDTKVYVYKNQWIELTNSIIDEKLPAPDEDNGHWAYTVQRYEDGKEKAELYLISHSINELEKNKCQIPLRENGIIKVKEPKEDLDAANKKYVDSKFEAVEKSDVNKTYVDTKDSEMKEYIDAKIADVQVIQGPKGDTPIRGTDYWTEADKEEIKAYVRDYIDQVILGGEW